MHSEDSYKRRLAAKASTFYERDKAKYISLSNGSDEDLINSRLEKWCDITSNGNLKQFKRRLRWDRIKLKKIRPFLGKVKLSNRSECPEWTNYHLRLMKYIASFSPNHMESGGYLSKEYPLPLEEFFIPLISFAEIRLRELAGKSYKRLSTNAQNRLKRGLLTELVKHSWKPLSIEYSIFRSKAEPAIFKLVRQIQGIDSNLITRKFVDHLSNLSNLTSFYFEYAVLARLTSTLINNWVNSNAIMLQRVDRDWDHIVKEFDLANSNGKVEDLEINLSDPHNGNKTVLILSFGNNSKVVYKPKDILVEKTFFTFLEWINSHKKLVQLKILKSIPRNGYGWVEFVPHKPCINRNEAALYYQRAGILLCIVYLFEGHDFHFENIIASGSHPVLVDLETLLQPEKNLDGQNENIITRTKAFDEIKNSVLKSGFLPIWKIDTNGSASDISALGGTEELNSIYKQLIITNAGSDDLEIKYELGKVALKKNVVRIKQKVQKPIDYVNNLELGFREAYEFILNNKENVLANIRSIFDKKELAVRVVFLSTMFYDLVAKQAKTLENLRDGVDWSIELDRITYRLNRQKRRPGHWPLVRSEHASFANMDLPIFNVKTNSLYMSIPATGERIKAFSETGYKCVLNKIEEFKTTDLETQLKLISSSIIARSASGIDTIEIKELALNNNRRNKPLSKKALIKHVRNIAISIKDQAMVSDDGSASWIALDYDHDFERYQLSPIRMGLYSGNAGVALFLAYFSHFDNSFKELSLSALNPIIKIVHDNPISLVNLEGIGGATGVGSIIYSLVHVGLSIDESSLIEDADSLALLMTNQIIENDRLFDVVAGSAGTILGLNKLYSVTKSNEVLKIMDRCGKHLLSHRETVSERGRSWKIGVQPPLAGFSHGAAGIAYALSILDKHINDSKYLHAIKEAIQFERDVFDESELNWPDFRTRNLNSESRSFMTTWCHGAPGIGLSRIGMYNSIKDEKLMEEIDQAIETTLKYKIGGVDHLCCGNFGRIEFLLNAGMKLGRPDLVIEAERRSRIIVEKAVEKKSFNLIQGFQGGVNSPGFFSGLSGIAYQLLRISDPMVYPSVLLWE